MGERSLPGSEIAGTDARRPVVVQKFGGSSVADVERIQKVADRIVETKRAGFDVVVVVSAMGKTTDGLIQLARSAAKVGDASSEPARRELDMLLSTGERVTMSLLSIAIQARGFPAISFTGSQSGILTNDRHFDARIIEVRPYRIEDELARGRIVIVAGYQGMSYKREVTTLGRGGSDTTAVALAAALEAERCEIYSDVDGVYSADPRVVPDAEHLPELDHALVQEMAESGAKVLCAQAIEWARKRGITIHARSTFDATRETIIRATPAPRASARAVVAEKNILFLRVAGSSLGEVAKALSSRALAFKDLASAAGVTTAIVPLLNVPSPDAVRAELHAALPQATLDDDVALVSVMGDGLASTPAEMVRFHEIVRAETGAEPLAVLGGPLRLACVARADRADAVTRALHAAFLDG